MAKGEAKIFIVWMEICKYARSSGTCDWDGDGLKIGAS